MEIKVREVRDVNLDPNTSKIIILPYNYESDGNYAYSSTSISFYKYAKNKLSINYYTQPELLVEQRSGEWFAPILFISSAAMTQNPEMMTIALSVIANYVTDFFKGEDIPNVQITVIHKETDIQKVTEIHYKGSLDGLNSLKESIEFITKKAESDG